MRAQSNCLHLRNCQHQVCPYRNSASSDQHIRGDRRCHADHADLATPYSLFAGDSRLPRPSPPAMTAKLDRTCSHCSRQFLKPAHLRRHLEVHAKSRPFLCRLCGKSLSRADALARHIRTAHYNGTSQSAVDVGHSAVPPLVDPLAQLASDPASAVSDSAWSMDGAVARTDSIDVAVITSTARGPMNSAPLPPLGVTVASIREPPANDRQERDDVAILQSAGELLDVPDFASTNDQSLVEPAPLVRDDINFRQQPDSQLDNFLNMLASIGQPTSSQTVYPIFGNQDLQSNFGTGAEWALASNEGSAPPAIHTIFGANPANDGPYSWLDDFLVPECWSSGEIQQSNIIQPLQHGMPPGIPPLEAHLEPPFATMSNNDHDDWSLPGHALFGRIRENDGNRTHQQEASPADILRELELTSAVSNLSGANDARLTESARRHRVEMM